MKIFDVYDDFYCLFCLYCRNKNLSIVVLSQQNFIRQKYQVYLSTHQVEKNNTTTAIVIRFCCCFPLSNFSARLISLLDDITCNIYSTFVLINPSICNVLIFVVQLYKKITIYVYITFQASFHQNICICTLQYHNYEAGTFQVQSCKYGGVWDVLL